VIRVALLAALLSACAPMMRWPYRGDYFCVRNATSRRVRVVQQDGAGRTWTFGRPVNPGKQTCARWGFVDDRGRFGLITGTDTTWREWFNPWAAR
jgi:hypothetical protein